MKIFDLDVRPRNYGHFLIKVYSDVLEEGSMLLTKDELGQFIADLKHAVNELESV